MIHHILQVVIIDIPIPISIGERKLAVRFILGVVAFTPCHNRHILAGDGAVVIEIGIGCLGPGLERHHCAQSNQDQRTDGPR